MRIQQKYDAFVAYFEEHMPIAESELHYKDPYQLLVAVILSAQCTDKRVNMTTPALFQRFPTAQDMAASSADEIYTYIKSISYPNNKAKKSGGLAEVARCGSQDCQCDDGRGFRPACYAGGYTRFPCFQPHWLDQKLEECAGNRKDLGGASAPRGDFEGTSLAHPAWALCLPCPQAEMRRMRDNNHL